MALKTLRATGQMNAGMTIEVMCGEHKIYMDQRDFSPPLKGDASCFTGCNSVKPRMTHASTSSNGSSSRL